MAKNTVKPAKTHPFTECVCSHCGDALEKNQEAFVCGSWSNFGYSWFCNLNCVEKAGYSLAVTKKKK